jgi:membrane-bound lytic murein transglycosylase C
MKKVVFSLLLSSQLLTLSADSSYDAMAKMNAEFAAYKANQESAFSDYKEKLDREYATYKKELEKYWKDPKLSTQKEWVSYSEDKKSRSEVDFENDVVVVEVIAKSKKEAEEMLEKQISYVVSKDTKQVSQTDPLQKRVVEISKAKDTSQSDVDAKPILETILFEKKPSSDEVNKYAKKALQENRVIASKSKFGDDNVYKVTIPLPSDTRLKRSKIYKEDVTTNAKRFEIPIPLVFAIMQTESDFNPFAKSHIPAFGLMQIVPVSAGKDVYKFLYKKEGMPTASYLYNGKNNIEMGSTYLHILYYRYLKGIKNPESRLYCAIAAYNTGAGNIAWAYTRSYSMKRAAPLINAMSPEEVYKHLMKNLRYDEPKHYLKNVTTRMSAYKKAYNL